MKIKTHEDLVKLAVDIAVNITQVFIFDPNTKKLMEIESVSLNGENIQINLEKEGD